MPNRSSHEVVFRKRFLSLPKDLRTPIEAPFMDEPTLLGSTDVLRKKWSVFPQIQVEYVSRERRRKLELLNSHYNVDPAATDYAVVLLNKMINDFIPGFDVVVPAKKGKLWESDLQFLLWFDVQHNIFISSKHKSPHAACAELTTDKFWTSVLSVNTKSHPNDRARRFKDSLYRNQYLQACKNRLVVVMNKTISPNLSATAKKSFFSNLEMIAAAYANQLYVRTKHKFRHRLVSETCIINPPT